jgi:hypothetical protein
MDFETMFERVKEVDITGILGVKKHETGKDDGSKANVALVEFWRLGGAFKEDKNKKINMIIDPDGPEGDLFFYVPNLEECEFNESALSIYMDANDATWYGAHRWKPENNGEVYFSYSLPVSTSDDSFPDIQTLQRILKNIYRSLLFNEKKIMQLRIANGDYLSEEEKKAHIKRIQQMYEDLINPKVSPSDAV